MEIVPRTPCVSPTTATLISEINGGAVPDPMLNNWPQLPSINELFHTPLKYKSVTGGSSTYDWHSEDVLKFTCPGVIIPPPTGLKLANTLKIGRFGLLTNQ